MNYSNNPAQKFITPISERLYFHLVRIEIISIIICIAGLLLMEINKSVGSIILTIILSTLGIVYYLIAFWNPSVNKNLLNDYSHKLQYLSYSVVIVGSLFIILNWPMALTFYYISWASVAMNLFSVIIVLIVSTSKDISKSAIIRTLTFGLILALLSITNYFQICKESAKENDKISTEQSGYLPRPPNPF